MLKKNLRHAKWTFVFGDERADAETIARIPFVSIGVAFERDKDTFHELSAPA
jgi:hypothetical protein